MQQVKFLCSLFISFIYLLTALIFLPSAFAQSKTTKTIEQAAPVTIDIDLPSSSTGVTNGTLALRIFAPSTLSEARYMDGAPVIIFAHGGESPGTLSAQIGRAEDVIRIVFMYPGGRDLTSGRQSSGTYDYRGQNSIAAMRDVILYAAGQLQDNQNRTIDQVVSVPVLHNNIGIFGSSNGGNMVTAVAAQYGPQLRGYLRYGIQWESPVSSQVAVGDIGRTALDCTTLGQPISINTANPWYDPEGYTSTALSVDYSRLRYNPSNSRRPVFWDGNDDGSYTTITYPSNPNCVTPDLNLDGVLSTNEDRPLTSYTFGPGRIVFSRQATQALLSNGVFTLATWPSTIATPIEAESFWNLREAVSQYTDATANISDYEGMSLAGYEDHIQYAPEKPHVHQAFDGWNGRGRWVKVNPSRSYVWEEEPNTTTRTDLPENSPNIAPDWTARSSYAYPDDLENVYYAAAVHEMADRARNRPVNTDTQAPTVRVISPNGGLLYKRGRSVTILWEASDNVGVVSQEVQLSTDGGQTYTSIVANLDGTTTSYVWNVSVALPSSKSCLIRVRASDAAGNIGSDTTDGYIAVW